MELLNFLEGIQGCVVECGTWKGGMIAAMAKKLGESRKYYLFDSFEGLPKAKEIDGISAMNWQRDVDSPIYYNNCRASESDPLRAMKVAGIKNFEVVKGWFNETLPKFNPNQQIALLRLDADWYDSTKTCLEFLFDKVALGGLIIIDDYYIWDGCSRALHDFLSQIKSTSRLYQHKEVCYILKS